MKIVLDSNIIIAAFAARGLCASLFEVCLDRYDIVISDYILDEVRGALQKKLKMPEASVGSIIDYLREFCIVSPFTELPAPVCRDSNDDAIIALAVQNGAKYLVTGDDDLLVLKKHGAVRIVSPRDFWEMARKEQIR